METVQREVLSEGLETTVRIVAKAEGEDEHRVYDFKGQSVVGVVVNEEDEAMTCQTFVVGASAYSMIRSIETLIKAVKQEFINEPDMVLERAAFGMMLAMQANQIAEEL